MGQDNLLPPPLPDSFRPAVPPPKPKSAVVPPPLPTGQSTAARIPAPPIITPSVKSKNDREVSPGAPEAGAFERSPRSPPPIRAQRAAVASGEGYWVKAIGSCAAVVLLGALSVGAFLWRERSLEDAKAASEAVAVLLENTKVQEQRQAQESQLAASEAQAQQEIARFLAEKQRAAEAALAMPASSVQGVPAVQAVPAGVNATSNTPVVSEPKLLLTDTVSAAETNRRATILRKLQADKQIADSRLRSLQVTKTFEAAGISAASVSESVSAIQSAVLASLDGKLPEPQLVAIDSLVKPARGNRKEARLANDDGLRMMQANRFQDAAVSFSRALVQDPADTEVLGNLSYAYLKNGQLDEALFVASYAVRISPRRGGTWNQIAAVYAKQGADWLAVRAYFVLYALSGDQVKTRDFLTRTSGEDADERVREAARLALTVVPEPVSR